MPQTGQRGRGRGDSARGGDHAGSVIWSRVTWDWSRSLSEPLLFLCSVTRRCHRSYLGGSLRALGPARAPGLCPRPCGGALPVSGRAGWTTGLPRSIPSPCPSSPPATRLPPASPAPSLSSVCLCGWSPSPTGLWESRGQSALCPTQTQAQGSPRVPSPAHRLSHTASPFPWWPPNPSRAAGVCDGDTVAVGLITGRTGRLCGQRIPARLLSRAR